MNQNTPFDEHRGINPQDLTWLTQAVQANHHYYDPQHQAAAGSSTVVNIAQLVQGKPTPPRSSESVSHLCPSLDLEDTVANHGLSKWRHPTAGNHDYLANVHPSTMTLDAAYQEFIDAVEAAPSTNQESALSDNTFNVRTQRP